MRFLVAFVALVATAATVFAVDYPTPNHLPSKTAPGQSGFNDCRRRWGDANPNSLCQNAYVNNINEWCIFAPAHVAAIGDAEADTVSWCTKRGFGTRIIPPGTIKGLQFIKVADQYLQLTAVGDFTKINVKAKDPGGELDNAGADNVGNPRGGKLFTNTFVDGTHYERSIHWHMFVAFDEISLRACSPRGNERFCPHTYDEQGSEWNDPGVYENGVFESCGGEQGEWPGWYHGKEWKQGQGNPPPAHPPVKTFGCKRQSGLLGLGSRIAEKDVPGS